MHIDRAGGLLQSSGNRACESWFPQPQAEQQAADAGAYRASLAARTQRNCNPLTHRSVSLSCSLSLQFNIRVQPISAVRNQLRGWKTEPRVPLVVEIWGVSSDDDDVS